MMNFSMMSADIAKDIRKVVVDQILESEFNLFEEYLVWALQRSRDKDIIDLSTLSLEEFIDKLKDLGTLSISGLCLLDDGDEKTHQYIREAIKVCKDPIVLEYIRRVRFVDFGINRRISELINSAVSKINLFIEDEKFFVSYKEIENKVFCSISVGSLSSIGDCGDFDSGWAMYRSATAVYDFPEWLPKRIYALRSLYESNYGKNKQDEEISLLNEEDLLVLCFSKFIAITARALDLCDDHEILTFARLFGATPQIRRLAEVRQKNLFCYDEE